MKKTVYVNPLAKWNKADTPSRNDNTDIYDVMRCPHCNGGDCDPYCADETEFGVGGDGHYHVDCHCKTCGKNFRLYMKFKYSVTESYTA